jgi:YD repeat-containing protein
VLSTGPNGAVTETEYDQMDRPVWVVLPDNASNGPQRVATISYDLVGNVVSETEPRGNLTPADSTDFVTSYSYDAVYQLTSATDAEGHQTSSVYDAVGNVVEQTDARGNTTLNDYDLNRRMVGVTDPAEHSTSTEYDLDGMVTASVDQQRGPRREGDQVSAQHRGQLPGMTVSELPQEDPQRGVGVHPAEQLVHPAGADDIQVVDAVRAACHPGDDRGQLRGWVGRPGPDPLTAEPDMLV